MCVDFHFLLNKSLAVNGTSLTIAPLLCSLKVASVLSKTEATNENHQWFGAPTQSTLQTTGSSAVTWNEPNWCPCPVSLWVPLEAWFQMCTIWGKHPIRNMWCEMKRNQEQQAQKGRTRPSKKKGSLFITNRVPIRFHSEVLWGSLILNCVGLGVPSGTLWRWCGPQLQIQISIWPRSIQCERSLSAPADALSLNTLSDSGKCRNTNTLWSTKQGHGHPKNKSLTGRTTGTQNNHTRFSNCCMKMCGHGRGVSHCLCWTCWWQATSEKTRERDLGNHTHNTTAKELAYRFAQSFLEISTRDISGLANGICDRLAWTDRSLYPWERHSEAGWSHGRLAGRTKDSTNCQSWEFCVRSITRDSNLVILSAISFCFDKFHPINELLLTCRKIGWFFFRKIPSWFPILTICANCSWFKWSINCTLMERQIMTCWETLPWSCNSQNLECADKFNQKQSLWIRQENNWTCWT